MHPSIDCRFMFIPQPIHTHQNKTILFYGMFIWVVFLPRNDDVIACLEHFSGAHSSERNTKIIIRAASIKSLRACAFSYTLEQHISLQIWLRFVHVKNESITICQQSGVLFIVRVQSTLLIASKMHRMNNHHRRMCTSSHSHLLFLLFVHWQRLCACGACDCMWFDWKWCYLIPFSTWAVLNILSLMFIFMSCQLLLLKRSDAFVSRANEQKFAEKRNVPDWRRPKVDNKPNKNKNDKDFGWNNQNKLKNCSVCAPKRGWSWLHIHTFRMSFKWT